MAKSKEWVIEKLQEFLVDKRRGHLSWPLDEDYDEHIKFVDFRNSTEYESFDECVKAYMEELM